MGRTFQDLRSCVRTAVATDVHDLCLDMDREMDGYINMQQFIKSLAKDPEEPVVTGGLNTSSGAEVCPRSL